MLGNKAAIVTWLDSIADISEDFQLAVINCLASGGPKSLTLSKRTAVAVWKLEVTGFDSVYESFEETNYANVGDLFDAVEARATTLGLDIRFVFSGTALSPWPFSFSLPFTYQDETGVYRYSDTCGQIVVVTDIFGNEVHVPTADGIVVVKDGRGKSVIATVDLLSTKAPTIAGDIVQEAIFSGPTTAVSVDVKPDGLPR